MVVNRKSWALAVLLCAVGQWAAALPSKGPSTEIEAKVALEGSLEKRLQAVLKEALGSDDLIVIVNVALLSESERVDAEIMPGVPAQQASALSGASGLALPMVSRLSATIIVDEATEAKDIELAKKIADGILGIAPARGDSLTIEKIKFHKPAAKPDFLRYSGLVGSALWLLFAALALTLIQRRFLVPLVANLRDISSALLLRSQNTEAAESDREAATAAALPSAASAHGAANGGRPNLPFSFINENDLPKLSHILRHSSASATATVIHYLPAGVASKMLAGLAAPLRQEVVSRLSQVSELKESEVRPLEDSVRQRIDYLMGGDDKLADLLEALPFDIQRDVLETIRRGDGALAERLGRRLVFLDDIASLESAELKLLSRRVPAKVLATVLKSSQALRESVLPKLAAGTREWLKQEIELSPDLSPALLEAARQPLLAAVSQLVREGRIVLRKKAEARPAEPQALRPPPLPQTAPTADLAPKGA